MNVRKARGEVDEEASPEEVSHSPGRGKPKAVYSIIETKGNARSYWLRLGTAYVNKDDSLSVVLNALPVNNRLHIRELPKQDNG